MRLFEALHTTLNNHCIQEVCMYTCSHSTSAYRKYVHLSTLNQCIQEVCTPVHTQPVHTGSMYTCPHSTSAYRKYVHLSTLNQCIQEVCTPVHTQAMHTGSTQPFFRGSTSFHSTNVNFVHTHKTELSRRSDKPLTCFLVLGHSVLSGFLIS